MGTTAAIVLVVVGVAAVALETPWAASTAGRVVAALAVGGDGMPAVGYAAVAAVLARAVAVDAAEGSVLAAVGAATAGVVFGAAAIDVARSAAAVIVGGQTGVTG